MGKGVCVRAPGPVRVPLSLLAGLCLLAAGLAAIPVLGQDAPDDVGRLVQAALEQVGVTLYYDPSYVKLAYPGGDVPPDRGVCTDVVVRALRRLGIDLQREVHEDMRSAFAAYPRRWGLTRPDRNIDHRRVPNLMTFFTRRGKARPPSNDGAAYEPGDIVAWSLPDGRPHIGILSDRPSGTASRWLAVHNIGAGAQVEDVLFQFRIIGHYRPLPWRRGHGPRQGRAAGRPEVGRASPVPPGSAARNPRSAPRQGAGPSPRKEESAMLMEQLPVGPMSNFTYVFGTGEGGEGFVVDPAFDAERILACIKRHRLDVTRIILTHHHGDHLNAAAAVKARTGAKILAHPNTRPFLQGAVALDGTLADGEGFPFGDAEVRVMHTPGHTPGGICLVVAGTWLVTGDTLFIGNCGRTDLPGSDARALYEHLQRLKRLPDDLLVLSGHDYGEVPSRRLGEEKLRNPVLRASSFEEFQAIP